jgi:hypothetical protein
MRMTQNRTNDNSSENIIEHVNEQELHNITGGCIGCAGIAVASTLNAASGLAQIRRAERAGREVPTTAIAQTIGHTALVAKTTSHASMSTVPCEHCIGNIARFVALKTSGL